LPEISIPAGATISGDAPFTGCAGLKKVVLHGPSEGTYVFNTLDILDLAIGNGTDPISVYDGAFASCAKLEKVTIEKKVTFGDYPFPDASSAVIKTVVLKGPVEGTAIFAGYSSITSLTFGDGVTGIAESAFDGCGGLTSILIPSLLTTGLVPAAFANCGKLAAVNVAAENTVYLSDDGVVYKQTGGVRTELILYPVAKTGVLELAESVTGIGEGAFAGSKLTGLIVNGRLSSEVDYGTFDSCNDFASLTVNANQPAEVAFAADTVKNLTIGAGVSTILEENYSGLLGLTKVVFQNGVISVPSGAFSDYLGALEVQFMGVNVHLEEDSFPMITGTGVGYFDDLASAYEAWGLGKYVFSAAGWRRGE
jgi:hypothetical protein